MRIINTANGKETTIGAAMSIVVDFDRVSELRDMMTRLLEELTREDDDAPVLRHAQLERVLAYKFKVED